MKDVARYAWIDIRDSIHERKDYKNPTKYKMGNRFIVEIWEVGYKHLMSKESRRLNRELGISKVNYTK